MPTAKMFIASVLVGACLIGCEQSEFVHYIYIVEVDGDATPGSDSNPPSDLMPDDDEMNDNIAKDADTPSVDDVPSSDDNPSITNEDLDVDE